MITYISFDQYDRICKIHPVLGVRWAALTDEDRQNYYDYIHLEIESHPWRGTPLCSPAQNGQFPRLVDCAIIRWDTDLNRYQDHAQYQGREIVIPSILIPRASLSSLAIRERFDLATLRDMGARKTKAGPAEVEFTGSVANTPQPDIPPLPEPLWTYVKHFSAEGPVPYQEQDSFHIQRG